MTYKAKKANRVVRIDEEKIDAYKALGYTISNADTGEVIFAPHNYELEAAQLKNDVVALNGVIDSLKAENASLLEQIEALKSNDGGSAEGNADAESDPPKKRGRAAKSQDAAQT